VNQVFILSQIDSIASQILRDNPGKKKFAFYGNLGAGKTTLVSAICKQLGVTDITSSPTFAVIQEYVCIVQNVAVNVAHMDWYRLQSMHDLQSASVMQYLTDDDWYCMIEWPNNVPQAIEDDVVKIYLDSIDEFTRQIKVG
jgi:tRNA threonylcarbamoyladenosine biosynthesis protein TsaE